jgi:hypothetical protein
MSMLGHRIPSWSTQSKTCKVPCSTLGTYLKGWQTGRGFRCAEKWRYGISSSSPRKSLTYARTSQDARVALIGFPSVGKSTLLSLTTKTASEAASYEFTTLTAIPGVLEYEGVRIQLLDLPGIVEGASQGMLPVLNDDSF